MGNERTRTWTTLRLIRALKAEGGSSDALGSAGRSSSDDQDIPRVSHLPGAALSPAEALEKVYWR